MYNSPLNILHCAHTHTHTHRSCRECLAEVYMPVIQMVLNAPPTSPLSKVNASNMADFLVYLSRPTQPNVSIICH